AAGSVAGHLEARNDGTALRGWPLAGALRLQTRSLGFIDSYVAQVDRVSGQLDANLTLTGSLAALGLNGELRVTGGEIDAYQINLALRDLNFDARLRDTVLQFSGSTRAGADGRARFDGELAWRNALPYGELHLTGENLRVVNIPEARVQASPDVRLKFAGRRIDVTGTVTLPYARLQRPDELTNAVRASGDEVIVSVNKPPARDEFHVFSDLTLQLGERVTIDTLGLVGRLSGSLRTVADDSGFNRGTGELQVEEGKYTAYGRRLDIERGRLQFKNGPLNDPVIDLRAIKKFPDITAGVNVRGTLRAPRMTFFSDPAVSQAQIVSLLLAGGSLESVQNNTDPTQRSNEARNNMLLQGSALLFQQFGGKVGLDDVSVESGLNNDTSLVLGRYLSPRLYVSYGISLAEAINTIKMRYTIGDHWTIKTEAGLARSADLVYTIER
ncbi:MAG: translocation/assembly module TamB domain-containing protein, partial [Gammaproteobacteria bacterium]|nr:translocation/assembly module TamB domain-containing protein [Gammaproteobacteria bacterium]